MQWIVHNNNLKKLLYYIITSSYYDKISESQLSVTFATEVVREHLRSYSVDPKKVSKVFFLDVLEKVYCKSRNIGLQEILANLALGHNLNIVIKSIYAKRSTNRGCHHALLRCRKGPCTKTTNKKTLDSGTRWGPRTPGL